MTAAEGSGKSINFECRKTPRTVSVHSASGGVFQNLFFGTYPRHWYSSTLDSSTLDSSVANYPNKCPFRLPRHKANQTTGHPGVASPVAATAEVPHRKRAGTRDLNHMNRPDQQKSTKPAILINCRHARIPSSVISISAASLSLRTRDKERSRSRWKLTQAEQSTACRIVLQRQPSRILLTAGNALLNEVHAFDTVVDVWIERITSIKIFS